ncbi:MAG TPA: C13 family peptidase [Candidatus Bathyarchaeia archaeon]|nr:C13 family peptidase [Candidatus Bathyarchaeia archaeon]
MIVVIESCYSGSFIGGGLDDETNRAILTSSKSNQLSWPDEFDGVEYGCFSYGIMSALDPDLEADDADENNDDHISIVEFFDYAYDLM